MEILSNGRDIYNRVNYCQMCGCTFQTNREDGLVELESGVSKLYVECPSCYSYILIGFSRQMIFRKGEKNK